MHSSALGGVVVAGGCGPHGGGAGWFCAGLARQESTSLPAGNDANRTGVPLASGKCDQTVGALSGSPDGDPVPRRKRFASGHDLCGSGIVIFGVWNRSWSKIAPLWSPNKGPRSTSPVTVT